MTYGEKVHRTNFLHWLADRLVHVYHESPNTDFVLRLKEIADSLSEGTFISICQRVIDRRVCGKVHCAPTLEEAETQMLSCDHQVQP